MAAAQTYDAVQLMLRALFQARGDTSAATLKRTLESLDKPYVGVVTTYEKPFSKSDHDAFTMNMIWLGTWRGGEIRYAYAEDEKRAGFIRRKQD
jgi:branched-chain amino acid transport system substrate-binding protein